MTTDNVCFYLQNRLIQTSQTGGQWYSDTSLFSIPWFFKTRSHLVTDEFFGIPSDLGFGESEFSTTEWDLTSCLLLGGGAESSGSWPVTGPEKRKETGLEMTFMLLLRLTGRLGLFSVLDSIFDWSKDFCSKCYTTFFRHCCCGRKG